MKKTTLYISQTLDGFIADQNNEIEFLNKYVENMEVINSFSKFIDQIEIQVMGSKTFDFIMQEVDGIWPYQTHITYVFTTKKREDTPFVKFINADVKEFVTNLQKQDKNIWIVGGNTIIKPLVDANLIDDYIICITEQIIGKGVRLFNGAVNHDLTLKKVRKTRDLAWLYLSK